MQPQGTPPSSDPSNPYDFILKDPQKPKKGFNVPSFGLPKRVVIIFGGVIAAFFVIIIAAAIFKGGGNSAPLTEVLGRAQEIVRVSKVVEPLAQNPDTKGLVATTETAFTSQQIDLTAYLKKHGTKVNLKSLSIYSDKTVDTQLQTAAQNNSLDSAYASYLKKSLMAYQNSLRTAAKGAPKARLQLLNDAFASTKAILAAPQVASASS
jgi:hypothetical protein